MFPVRYELNSYINLLRNSVFKGLTLFLDFSLFLQLLTSWTLSIILCYLKTTFMRLDSVFDLN
jgi:hypothetical protein